MKDLQQDSYDFRNRPLDELMAEALRVKLMHRPQKMSLCSIINARSGQCSEDCKFCVQSAHYETDIPVYPLLDSDEIVRAAEAARDIGAEHFSIVTSGRGMRRGEVEKVAAIVSDIRSKVGIRVCASLGIVELEDFLILRDAGLTRYHHNIETSREYFPSIVTTHTFEDRLKTIEAAQEAGLQVCAGGIIGLGETEEDRVSMARTLKDCGVDSVPINILIQLPGTPLEKISTITVEEILRAIAIFRIVMGGDVPVRLAAGRETALRDFLGMAFMAGADGMMIGGYLTQRGRPPEDDHRLIRELMKLWTA